MGGQARLAAELAKHRKAGLDSVILIYHLEGLAPYAELTEVIFTALARGQLQVVLSTISVTELLVKPFVTGQEERIHACEQFLLGLPSTSLMAPEYEVAKRAARLRAQYGLRTPDALLLATALEAGASVFLTNDAQLRRAEKEGMAFIILDDYLEEEIDLQD